MKIKNIDTSHMKNNKFFELHAEINRRFSIKSRAHKHGTHGAETEA